MRSVERKLLCTWYVDKNWRQFYVKLVVDLKKALVYKTLRIFLQTTYYSIEQCYSDLKNVIRDLMNDDDTNSVL